MRNLVLLGAAALLLVAVGCSSDEEQRRAKAEDDRIFWGGLEHKPDIALGIEDMPTTPPVAAKPPAANQAPAVVQVGGKQ